MSYLVLARKYRPTTFAALVGQEAVVRTLRNAMQLGRVHHAFVLAGARGVGKTTTARLLARGLNCASGPTVSPCGTCSHCKAMDAGTAPDVIEIDGASNTGVDSVRELREATRYMPAVGRYKLYIIDEVHMLSQAAFNALLKTLEEPPAHIKFIFATTEPHKIPITILSRCQRFDLRRLDVTTLVGHLAWVCKNEGVEIAAASLAPIAREAQGSVRDALSLLDQVLSYAGDRPVDEVVLDALGVVDRQAIFALVDAIIARDASRLLLGIDNLAAAGHDLVQVMAMLLSHLRDVAVAAAVAEPQGALPERDAGEVTQLVTQGQRRSQADWHRLFRVAYTVANDVAQASMPKMALEMGLLRLLQVAPTADLSDLLSRLDQLMTQVPIEAGSVAPAAQFAPPVAPRARADTGHVAAARAEPAAAVATEPVSDNFGAKGWRSFVERVRGRRPDLASVLEQGHLVAYGPKGVEVAYTPGTFFFDAANDSDNRVLFAELLQGPDSAGAQTFKVVAHAGLSAAGAASPTLAQERQQAQKDAWAQTQESAHAHAHVRAAVDILGGEVRAIERADDKEQP